MAGTSPAMIMRVILQETKAERLARQRSIENKITLNPAAIAPGQRP
jgi:hypothetical protein